MPRESTRREWLELVIRPTLVSLQVTWAGHSTLELAKHAMKLRRGKSAEVSGLRFVWTGTYDPPDFLAATRTLELVSERVADRLHAAGVRGLSTLAVGLEKPDGSEALYGVLSVAEEVDSICFGRSAREDRLFRLTRPYVQGLRDDTDAYILPEKLELPQILVSDRVSELVRRTGFSGVSFKPLDQLEVSMPDPDQLLC